MEKDRKVEVDSCSGGEWVRSGAGVSGCNQAWRDCGRGGERSGRDALDTPSFGEAARFVRDMIRQCLLASTPS